MFVGMPQSNRCSMCTKGAGTCLCAGCKKYFCRKHFNDHHAILVNELEGYVEEINILQDEINRTDPHNGILLQIDEWERTMVEKVTQVAERLRQQIKNPSPKRVEIISKFTEFRTKLRQLKETDDFVEDDLSRLKETIDKFKQDSKELDEILSIKLHIEQTEQIAWDRFIYVEEKSTAAENKQEQQQTTEKNLLEFLSNKEAP
ncbi:unnamed protein product [Rotaria sordida]|nr:unnamed protein product [Rotaria sordida]CAF4184759.1 unnamed protein product [Rotaria sordida]